MNKLFRPRAVLLAFTFLYIAATALSAARDILIETSLVTLDVVIALRHDRRAVGLAKEHFDLYENSARKEITHIATDEIPLRLSLVFDLSVSIRFAQKVWNVVIESTRSCSDRLDPENAPYGPVATADSGLLMTTDRHPDLISSSRTHSALRIFTIMDGFRLGTLSPAWQATCNEHYQLDSCSNSHWFASDNITVCAGSMNNEGSKE